MPFQCYDFRLSSGDSWADKVKGISPKVDVAVTEVVPITINMDSAIPLDSIELAHDEHDMLVIDEGDIKLQDDGKEKIIILCAISHVVHFV